LITSSIIRHLRMSLKARVLLGLSIEHLLGIYIVPVLTLSVLAVISTGGRVYCFNSSWVSVWLFAIISTFWPFVYLAVFCLMLLYNVFSSVLGGPRIGPVSVKKLIELDIHSTVVATALLFAFGTEERDIRRCTTKVVDAYRPAQAGTKPKTSEDSKKLNVE
jgi:hypothetical protein